ncbi:MAG: mechanosensitive ion channel family protein [Desulfobacterales bacterium]
MKHVQRTILGVLILLMIGNSPAAAQPAGEAQNDTAPPPLPLKAVSDSAIRERLRALIDNIADFQQVQVEVKGGVVALSGKTPRAETAEKVAQVASRFEGVVYVDNRIAVEDDVEARVKPAFSRMKQVFVKAVQKLPIIGVALAVVSLFWLIAHLVTRWELPYRRLGSNRLLRNLIRQFLRKGIFLLGVVLALDILDVSALVGAVLGTAGVVGLAIGFAFKDIVENYLAGILLSIRRPFDLLDLVRIDAHEGRVTRLSSSELVLMTLEGNHVRIPNATVFKSIVYNYNINPRRRFDFGLGVGTGEDLVDVQTYGCNALRAMEGLMDEPAPFMIVEELGDFSVLIRFYGWVDQRNADFAKVRGEAIRRVKLALDKAGVVMPEPAQTIRMMPVETAATEAPATPESRIRNAAHQETKQVDLSPDRQLDEQISEDLAEAADSNLLTDA